MYRSPRRYAQVVDVILVVVRLMLHPQEAKGRPLSSGNPFAVWDRRLRFPTCQGAHNPQQTMIQASLRVWCRALLRGSRSKPPLQLFSKSCVCYMHAQTDAYIIVSFFHVSCSYTMVAFDLLAAKAFLTPAAPFSTADEKHACLKHEFRQLSSLHLSHEAARPNMWSEDKLGSANSWLG